MFLLNAALGCTAVGPCAWRGGARSVVIRALDWREVGLGAPRRFHPAQGCSDRHISITAREVLARFFVGCRAGMVAPMRILRGGVI